jgi:hypothetical protein
MRIILQHYIRCGRLIAGEKCQVLTTLAIFFLPQYTKTVENIPNNPKITLMSIKNPKLPLKIPMGHKICQPIPFQGPPKFT